MKETVIVFGGDGFCGWPTSLHLSKEGFKIVIVDNLSRRKIDTELGSNSLTPIQPIDKRIQAWEEITKEKIKFELIDISNEYDKIVSLLKEHKPKAIVHFAEQRAAPYSMKSSTQKRYTINNNINVTHNILSAIVESGLDIHMIHLGSTGVYGYSSIGLEIPEGYLNVKVDVDGKEKEMEILYPPHPGSIYHLTKTMDALIFAYYNKNDNLRITDLHQGIVWGTQTDETKLDVRLINRFDYDGDYGTVLNRFIMQAATGHPLTVHGTGGQTRAFINIKDTVKCINLAINNPPNKNEKVKIFNQSTEQHTVSELAKKLSKITNAKIRYYINPRNEDSANTLKVSSKSFFKLGLNPIKLNDGLVSEIYDVAVKYKDNCDKSKIICSSVWKKDMIVDEKGSDNPIK